MATIEEMSKFPIFSNEWFYCAFENCKASAMSQIASKKICMAYGITGQVDPAYIANVIEEAYNKTIKF
jgi:hypothetical protein